MGQGQNVLITGTSSGFGLLTARTLLQKGHTVFATMRGVAGKNAAAADGLRKFAEGQDGTLHLLELDVTNDASVDNAVKTALKLSGRLDVVVNNAGTGSGGLAESFTVDQFKQLFEVNLFGVQRVNRAVLPSMRDAGKGLLIQVSSIMGRIVIPFSAPYTATKWALEGLTESYRYELSGTGIDVVCVEPGGFPTGVGERAMVPADKLRAASYGALAELPDKMWGGMMQMMQGDDAPDPQDVADAILQLIETPAGQRPLRTVVDPLTGGEGPSTLNRTSDRIQKHLLDAFNMGDLLSVKPED